MLLTFDIGNTSVKLGVFDGAELVQKRSAATADTSKLEAMLAGVPAARYPAQNLKAIACSVVPDVTETLKALVRRFGIGLSVIDSTVDLGLKVHYQPLASLGTDRLVNAFAASKKYGFPVIVCSLGTATTVDLVDERGDFAGGVIAPGLSVLGKALHEATAQLPEVEITRPGSPLGTSTETAIRAGIFNGYIGLVEGLIGSLSRESAVKPKVVVTGGNLEAVAAATDLIDFEEPQLTLEGLRLIAEMKLA